jgi:hypothetical protein
MAQTTLDFSAYIAERTRDFTGRERMEVWNRRSAEGDEATECDAVKAFSDSVFQ